jgi:hypothetical protein
MRNTKFFDMKGFREFLEGNFSGTLCSSSRRKGEALFVEPRGQESSFQIVYSDFLLSQSVTCGSYDGGRGYYEELRMKFGNVVHFVENVHIPSGKYRIRVDKVDDGLPNVRTFVRGVFRWKRRGLPMPLDLSHILKGDVRNYNIG